MKGEKEQGYLVEMAVTCLLVKCVVINCKSWQCSFYQSLDGLLLII